MFKGRNPLGAKDYNKLRCRAPMTDTPKAPRRIQPPVPPPPSVPRRPRAPVPDAGLAGGPDGRTPEKKIVDPTRYGDWEKNGRCIDF